jgi:hypothetical protein
MFIFKNIIITKLENDTWKMDELFLNHCYLNILPNINYNTVARLFTSYSVSIVIKLKKKLELISN